MGYVVYDSTRASAYCHVVILPGLVLVSLVPLWCVINAKKSVTNSAISVGR